MPKIAITILIFLFLFGNMGLAQQINGDSIKSLLPGTPANTVLYAQRIQELSQYYRRINPDSAIYLADISLNIGLALNDHTIINTAKFLKANVLSDRHNQKEARALYDEALSEFKIANNQKMLMQTMNNYGATYNRENNFTEGQQWFQKSMQIAQDINDVRGQAAVLGNTGFIEEMTGNKQRGIELYMQALRLCEQAGDWFRVAALYNNIGAVYSNMGDNQDAIKYTLKACQINQKNKILGPLKSGLYNLTFYYNEVDSSAAALQTIEEAEKVPYPATSYQKALGFVIKAQIEEHKMNYPVALALLDSCVYYANSDADGIMHLHNANATRARIFITQKQYEKAIKYAKTALDIALKINDPISINLDQKLLAQGYSGLGKQSEALKFLWAFENGRDSIYTKEKMEAINGITQKYEVEKKELTIDFQKNQIEYKNWLLLLTGLACALAVVLFFVELNRRRSKHRQLEAEQQVNQFLQAENARLLENNEELMLKLESKKGSKLLVEEIKELRVTLSNQRKTVLRVGDITYIRADEKKTIVICTADGKEYREFPTLDQYQKLLEHTTAFVRTHRSYLVSRLHITERMTSSLTLTSGESIPIAETSETRKAVHKWLDEWL